MITSVKLVFLFLFTLLFSKVTTKMTLPKLIAFDLDGTIWTPDMYQLWGGGAPFKVANNGRDLVDNRGQTVKMLGIADKILEDLKTKKEYEHIKVAWVSCTDEPSWADECMTKFKTPSGLSLKSCVSFSHIYKSNKQVHFKNIKREFNNAIEFEDMLFFDNERGNIQSVSKLGVKSYYCPDGMTEKAWQDGLAMFS